MISTPQMTWEDAVIHVRNDPAERDFVRYCYYDDPLRSAAERYWKSSEWAAIRKLLPEPSGEVLDVGAGRGISTYAFARDGWNVSALEPNPSLVVGAGAIRSLADEAELPINVCEQWGEMLPFDRDRFDVVYCRAVLHHARDLQALGCEIARVLKPGGLFIGTREHVVSSHDDIPAFQDAHPLHRLYGGEYAYTVKEYTGALNEAGLVVQRVFNPYESDINLFPSTIDMVRRGWARRFGLPVLAPVIPMWLIALRGKLDRTPGRLYTFVARKPIRH